MSPSGAPMVHTGATGRRPPPLPWQGACDRTLAARHHILYARTVKTMQPLTQDRNVSNINGP
jgi:hypothetical protein